MFMLLLLMLIGGLAGYVLGGESYIGVAVAQFLVFMLYVMLFPNILAFFYG